MLRTLTAPAPADWTMATHHFLVADLRHCTLCGARPEVVDQVLARQGAVGIATVICLACRGADPDREQLRAHLQARYDPARFGTNTHGGAHGPNDRQ
jgi:hypothetical protein